MGSCGSGCSTAFPNPDRTVKVHHLVKAPENTASSVSFRESGDADEPATVYVTPERLPNGEECQAATVIFRTKGCVWWWKSGCTFCGYFNDVRDDVTSENLHAQWEYAKRKLNDFDGCSMLKVYTSGTFFEDRENPPDWQETILTEARELGLHLIVEARAEMCTPDKMAWVAQRHPGCTVAIGLEAYDDEVLKFHCNKGFSTRQWERAVDTLRKNGLRVKTYLLFKPPFMSEGDALEHCVSWIRDAAGASDEISINPMNIQKRTIVERMFRHREYRPPWLWSLVELIRRVHPQIQPAGAAAHGAGAGKNGGQGEGAQAGEQSEGAQDATKSDASVTRMIVHPTAAGKIRGAHNCGKCDRNVAAAIERYSVSADLSEFTGLACECEARWRAEVELDLCLPIPLGSGLDRRGDVVEALLSV